LGACSFVIGEGQGGLAAGYQLARRGTDFVIIDAGQRPVTPGGAARAPVNLKNANPRITPLEAGAEAARLRLTTPI
jgi:glycine/D-amino acid oxidase-like deaminating enzyme